MPKKLFLVDGSNHAFRVQYALPPQHASNGFPTRTLYGFTLLFQKMMRTYRPDYCAVSFDAGKTFRHEMYPGYKANRSSMPEDMRRQWEWLPKLVHGFGYPTVYAEGFEADDVLGTLAKRFASDDLHVYLVTSDKDFCQLLDPNISLLDDMKNQTIAHDGVVGKLGVRPEQVIDMLGLAGDSSDNIPGVPGIGAKTAATLLDRHGDLEGVLQAAQSGEIKGKRGENLKAHADDARISARLATIATDVELPWSLDDLVPQGIQEEPLRELFDRWEFGMVARKLLPKTVSVDTSIHRAVTDIGGIEALFADLRAVGRFAVALRTTSSDPARAHVIGASFSWEGNAVYLPLEPGPRVQYDPDHARDLVLQLLADADIEKVGHDLKATLRVCRAQGGDLRGIVGDTKLLDYVLVAHRRQHGMEDLAQRHLGHNLAFVPDQEPLMLDDVARFAAEPAHVAWILHDKLSARLDTDLGRVYHEIELPLLPVLADLEEAGIGIDLDALAAVRADVAGRVDAAEKRCHELAGRTFKVGSPKEVGKLLFEELGLPKAKRTRTGGYSTDSSVLEKLVDVHDLPAAILDYRQLHKLDSTYLRKLPSYVADDGRIHTTFNQAVAATGRLSSTDPNMQNIPVRTFEGRRIRDCFVPAPGHVFLSADYSQVELRVLAHFSGSDTLGSSFRSGEDIHRRTASEVWGLPIDQVTAEQRSAAKAINFGLLYGMSAFRLGRDLSISHAEAKKYMDDYFERLPSVSEWIESTKDQCRRDGYVSTLFGRRRLIPEIYSKNYSERSAGEREAVNTCVQGTAADIIKIAMIRVHRALRQAGARARILLQVHDELLLEVPMDEVDRVRGLVTEEMMASAELTVPLDVNSSIGSNWNEAHG